MSQREAEVVLAAASDRELLVKTLVELRERDLLDAMLQRLDAYKQRIHRGAAVPFVTALFDIGAASPARRACTTSVRRPGRLEFSPSNVTQLFAATKWTTGDVRVTFGRSTVTGNGAVPEELLASDRAAVFTHPDETRNDMAMLSTRLDR